MVCLVVRTGIEPALHHPSQVRITIHPIMCHLTISPTMRLLVSSYFGFFFCSKTCEASLMKTVNPYLGESG